ncbi:MAG: transposase [Clostridia bacterium]|nr:transposase [Clostridia bacterium]
MNLPKRKPTRLKGYDYSQNGAYFITICTNDRKCILGNIGGQGLAPAEIILSQYGKIAKEQLLDLEKRYKTIRIDKYVIMPNHIHIIVILDNTAGASPCPTISDVICSFKSLTTRICNKTNNKLKKIFQTSFHDHIIRGEKDYQKIWEYIDTNVIRWEKDCFYNIETEQ